MKVLDDYLESSILDSISNCADFFPGVMQDEDRIASELNSYHDEQASCYAPYMFWHGWWSSPVNTIRKRVIKEIWESNLPIPVSDVLGFEYWTRTFGPGQFLGPHVDEDTFLYQDKKIYNGPETGCVYYGPSGGEIIGGFLELFNSKLTFGEKDALEWDNLREKLDPIELRERIAFRENRLIIFDAGRVIHQTSPCLSGFRNVMVVNVWLKSNPPLDMKNFVYEQGESD
jgi:hypothetical protein